MDNYRFRSATWN